MVNWRDYRKVKVEGGDARFSAALLITDRIHDGRVNVGDRNEIRRFIFGISVLGLSPAK